MLEQFRQPLEEGTVTIARSNGTLTFPARLMLVAAMNPCPCGFYGDPTRECRCTPGIIQRYLAKVSGPLLDRIDMHIEVPAGRLQRTARQERRHQLGADSRTRRSGPRHPASPRILQRRRSRTRSFAQLCALDEPGERTLEMAVRKMNLSARAHDRILRVARTIADLDHCERVSRQAPR